ncbi:hypothetical protein IT575_00115 [bacterium]|nr:hypothetical protein [bacterium]
MFQNFDYGKSLLKQLEAYRRLPAPQQQKRHPAMVKQLEQYALRFLQEVTKSGSSNPGMLKNGAEAMVEAAFILQEPISVYQAFAEMAGRSRKVPVVPGLAAMVDKLLEMPTSTKKERATLLSWRIVTGTMRPERHIKYLAERAHLTESGNDWKEYAYGVIQLVRKDSIKLTDELVSVALSDLLASKNTLGDQSVPLQLLAAESLIIRKNLRQAEQVLIDLAREGNEGNPQLLDMVRLILDARADSSWELHQMALAPLLRDFTRGSLMWNPVHEKLSRARIHEESMAHWLIENADTVRERQLVDFTTLCIMDLPPDISKPLLNRWHNVLTQSGWQDDAIAEVFQNAQVRLKERSSAPAEKKPEPVAEAPKESKSAKPAEKKAQPAPEPVVAAAEPEPVPAEAVEAEAAEIEAIAEAEPVMASAVEEPEAEVLEAEAEEAEAEPESEPEVQAEAEPQEEPAAETDAEELEVPVAAAADNSESESLLPRALRELLAAEPQPAQYLAALGQQIDREGLSLGRAEELLKEVSALEGPDWARLETRMWLVEQLLYECDVEGAAALFSELVEYRNGPEMAQARELYSGPALEELLGRIYKAAGGDDLPSEIAAPAGTVALSLGDWRSALKLAGNVGAADPRHGELYGQIEQWLVSNNDSSPAQLIALASAQRGHRGDAAAGLEAATTAALLAPDDEEVVAAYKTWASQVPAAELHRQRAQQATYFCAREQRYELLETALDEIAALVAIGAADSAAADDKQLMDWLEQLRPVLDKIDEALRTALRFKWTRAYLTLIARTEKRSLLPAALKQASTELAPAETLELVHALAAAIPTATRVEVECDSLLRQGQWEQAVQVVGAGAGSGDGIAVHDSLELIYDRLPTEHVVQASRRLSGLLAESAGADAQLEMIKFLHERFIGHEHGGNGNGNGNGNGHSAPVPELDGYIDEALAELIAQRHEPALRFRLSVRQHEENVEQSVRDLLELARQGDSAAIESLGIMLEKLCLIGEPKELILSAAEAFASSQAGSQPDRVVGMLCQAGLAAEQPGWALERVNTLSVYPSSPASLNLMGQVAIRLKDYDLALKMVEELNLHHAYKEIKPLLTELQAAKPDSEPVLMASLLQVLNPESQDLPQAFNMLLQYTQVLQGRGASLAEGLAPVREPIEALTDAQPGEIDAKLLQIALFASTGQLERASRLVQDVVNSGPVAANRVLALFDRLALQDADLPSGMVLAWGQALFDTGRFAEALDRIAGLRNAVGDYPEYMALLEEIKKAGGGAGASMQLAEAYMRVHLWPRSAEEYAQALSEDLHLAEPILTQLRNHGALDPHPMKYPLQVVALRAVAESSREADWQWALSALTWLTPRWSAEELYAIGAALRQKVGNVELEKSQIVDLLMNLHQLALRAGDARAALDYLAEAWELREHSDHDLGAALRNLDTSKLPDDPALWMQLRRLEMEIALGRNDGPAVLETARLLAGTGKVGRDAAQQYLRAYEQRQEDPVPVRIERLKLLDLEEAASQQEFISSLIGIGRAELPGSAARELARMTLPLAQAKPGDVERQRALLMLLHKLGDYSRAWHLAQWHAEDRGPGGKEALVLMEEAASSEFAVTQQVDMVETHLRRGEFDRAAAALEKLQWANLGETPSGEPLPEALGLRAADLAESLLAQTAASDAAAHMARRWLVSWYRERGQTALAADHLVWAYLSGLQLPAAWLHDADSADLLYRSGQLHEAQGSTEQALRQYRRARQARAIDDLVPALVRLRLSSLAEAEGEIHEAYELAQEALDVDPSGVLAKRRVDSLKRYIYQHQVEMARNQPDSAQRSLAIARLQRSAGELSEAISELQAAIGRGQNDAEIYVELAECFVDNGEFNIARRAYNEVIKRLETEQREPELRLRALYGLATAEEHLSNREQAILLLEQLLVIRHNYRDSRQRLDRLYAGESSLVPTAPAPKAESTAKSEAARTATSDILDELLALLKDPGDGRSGGKG